MQADKVKDQFSLSSCSFGLSTHIQINKESSSDIFYSIHILFFFFLSTS